MGEIEAKAMMEQQKWIVERYEATADPETKAYLRGYEAGMHYIADKLYKRKARF